MTVYWTATQGGTEGNWTDGANWSSGVTPTASDDVNFETSGSYGVLLNTAVSVGNIWFDAPFSSLFESAAGSFSIPNPAAQLFVLNGYVELKGANSFGNALVLGGAGVLEVGNSHALGNSAVSGSGGELIGTAAVTLPNAMEFYTGATTVAAGSGALTIAGTGQVDAPGTLIIGATTPGLIDGPVVWTGNFVNNGFVKILAGSLTVGAAGFTNTGIVEGFKRTNPDGSITWTPDSGPSLPTFYGGSADNVFALTSAPNFVDGGGGTDTADVRASMTFSAGSVANVETFKIENNVAADLSALTAPETIVFGTPAGGSASVKGGQGVDTVDIPVARADATIVHNANGSVAIATANGGSDTLSGVEWAQFADQRVSLAATAPAVLLRNGSGAFADWTISGSKVLASTLLTSNGAAVAIPAAWTVNGLGDFDGDKNADILLRNTNGTLADWTMNGAQIVSSQLITEDGNTVTLPAAWSVAGLGDFDGGGHANILLRNSNGTLADWTMNGSQIKSAELVGAQGKTVVLPAAWSVAGLGDFDGDGKANVLLRNANGTFADWTMDGSQITSSQLLTSQGATVTLPAAWSVAAIGDFNGDGLADVLMRNANGRLADWTMDGSTIQSSDIVTSNGAPVTLDPAWSVAALGDFSGDGKTDILFRNANGFAEWTMNGASIASASALTTDEGQHVTASGWKTQGSPTDPAFG